jgi:endogenous inhibitor of DNA gyrase (YacG/DUF329 family)
MERTAMGLTDPVAVYNAGTNMEAVVVCEALMASGIEAHVVEDASPAGMWMFGLLPEIHKPQVWVDRANLAAAEEVLANYEQRRQHDAAKVRDSTLIPVECEECGKQLVYTAEREGAIETCPECGAYVDVGESEIEGWEEE